MADFKDKLTGIYTEDYFIHRLEEELLRTGRYKRPLTLLSIEINYNFFMPDHNIRWSMNYTLLKQFGALLREQLRNIDIAGRYGGETFLVMLPETPMDGGVVAGERIRRRVEQYSFLGDSNIEQVRLAVNCGLATFPQHGKTVREIISSAQQAMLISRNDGGNSVVICPNDLYSPGGESLLYAGGNDVPEIGEDKSLHDSIEKKRDELLKRLNENIDKTE